MPMKQRVTQIPFEIHATIITRVYLREKYGVEIYLPKASADPEKNRRKKLEVDLIRLMQEDTQIQGVSS